MQGCIILEPMYVVRKEAQLLALDLWVGHALDHQKESSGQEQGHVSRTLFAREPNVSIDGVCCDIDCTLKGFWEIENCGIEGHDTVIFN